MDKRYAEILDLAGEAARKAGTFIRAARKDGLRVNAKSPIDFVSDKDLQSEDMIREMIRAKYPDHLFFGEESVSGCSAEEERARIEAFRDEDFVWVVDPIDGTVNYIRDYAEYAVSVAVVHRREIVAGAVYDPGAEGRRRLPERETDPGFRGGGGRRRHRQYQHARQRYEDPGGHGLPPAPGV